MPPVGEIDAFLHHKSGCKKASTYGKTHFAFGCGGQKARHFRMFSRVPPRRSKGKGKHRKSIPLLIYSISKIMSVDNGVFEQCRQMYLFTMGKNTGVALATFAYDV